MALAAGNMGSWGWSRNIDDCIWDDGQYGIFGVDRKHFAVTAENVRALIHPDDWTLLQTSLERLMTERKPAQAEFRVKRPTGEVRWCIGTAAPTIDGQGRVARVSGVTVDITDRKVAEERQALLAREVDHRAKNALALVQSIVRLTRAGDVSTYTKAVEGRIRALSRAHTVLALSRWQGADIRGLVEEELAPYRTGDTVKIVANGPNVSLQPAAAQSLALALHELVTNAAKYGALSSVSGRVDLTWELNPGLLVLRWTESGGPPTQIPSSPGFGTRIITGSVEGQLGGRTVFDWSPEGLKCVLSIPREDMTPVKERRNGSGGKESENSAPAGGIVVSGNRIMIVEDEALVAMALRESLDEMGFSVLGPFSRIAEAMVALRNNQVDAAVLDVNLGGELVYPLADVLSAGRVPFIFVTGYGSEEVDRRFAGVPMLQKPIQGEALRATLLRPQAVPPQLPTAAVG
jgi:PAS domain S-box-containing protein